ncbi:hypothetical protein SDC9_173396 [bioreactor metagenome]|uniref:Uncharacterized protein n=1 Tax=bioreactor metagenome TaxID=1076179 RepID=A0A645GPU1_9ZZZZ
MIGGSPLKLQSRADKRKHDHNPCKTGHQQQNGRRERQQSQREQDLEADIDILASSCIQADTKRHARGIGLALSRGLSSAEREENRQEQNKQAEAEHLG